MSRTLPLVEPGPAEIGRSLRVRHSLLLRQGSGGHVGDVGLSRGRMCPRFAPEKSASLEHAAALG
jgi:hypothetical protein